MDEFNKDIFESSFEKILKSLGNKIDKDGTKDTPKRVAKAYEELLSGYTTDIKETINNALFDVNFDEIIIVKNIKFYSLCEHHMLPFFGKIDIGYLPSEKIIGLSKIPKIIEIFSKRLQVQENLTNQISSALDSIISPHGLGVVVEARHTCSIMRGDNFSSSNLITSSMHGSFRSNLKTRQEFLSHIEKNILWATKLS